MKLFGIVLLCSAILYVRCQDHKEKLQGIANECKTESGATDADVEAMIKREPAGSTEAKCLRACVMKKFEVMGADGKLVKDAALAIIKIAAKGDADKEKSFTEILDACEAIEVADDHCEAAEQYGACMKQQAQDKGVSLNDV